MHTTARDRNRKRTPRDKNYGCFPTQKIRKSTQHSNRTSQPSTVPVSTDASNFFFFNFQDLSISLFSAWMLLKTKIPNGTKGQFDNRIIVRVLNTYQNKQIV